MLFHHNGIREDASEPSLVLVGDLTKSKTYRTAQDSNKLICNKLKNVQLNNGLMDTKVWVTSIGLLIKYL
jgi:hypothetical protein